MDGDAQTLAVADLLTPQHMLTHIYQGRTGSADMLLHGNHHLLGGDGLEGSACGGHLLIILGMDAAKKQLVHGSPRYVLISS
jgi:hypothetical protein